MLSWLRGKLFFVGTGAFALGILWGTLSSLQWQYLLLSIFVGVLCLLLGLLVPAEAENGNLILCAVGVALVCLPIGEVRVALAPHALPSSYVSFIKNAQAISLTGTIIADPDIRQKNQQLVVQVNSQASVSAHGQQTNILVFAPLSQYFSFGERVLIAGTLTAPTPFTTDTGRIFRYDNFLAKKKIFAVMLKPNILEASPPKGFIDAIADFLFAIKHVFVQGLSRALPDPYAELATGLLTGDQHGLTDSLVTMLALSGLIWIVVLSGYHVTLIAEGVLTLFSFLPRRFGFMFAGVTVTALIFATGASAPSLRGGAMAALTLFARSTHRNYDALRALSVAVILILLWDPFLLAYDSGFQLSIVVTPALLLGVPILETRLLWIKSAFIREVIAVSIVAQVACLPLILWQTGQLGIWAIPANVFVMWLVPFAMLASVIAGFVGVIIPQLAPLLGLPAYGILYYMLMIAKAAATLPLANVILPSFPFFFVIGMYAILIWIFWRLKNPLTPPRSKTFSQQLPS